MKPFARRLLVAVSLVLAGAVHSFPADRDVSGFEVWRVKAIVLDAVENSTPPAYLLRVVDAPAENARHAYNLAAAWCRDGIGTKISEDETEIGWAFYPSHRVQKCEAYPAN